MSAEEATADGGMEAVESVHEKKQKFIRASSKKFEEANPYVSLVQRGNYYPPAESGFKDADDQDSEEETYQEVSKHASNDIMSLAAFLDMEKDPPSDLTSGLSPTSAWYRNHANFSPSVVWHVKIFSDDYNDKRHCTPDGKLKKRRGVPHMRVSELLGGLKQGRKDRWIFDGNINDWPAFKGWVLQSITTVESSMVKNTVKRVWSADDKKPPPTPEEIPKKARATFLAPAWSAVGWSPESPGFAWWYSEMHGEPRMPFGERLLEVLDADMDTRNASVTQAHIFAHRYPVEKETIRDKQTYHAGLAVEWSHGKYMTVFELAWRNGVGGYGGKANWCEDKLEAVTTISKTMPGPLIQPWQDSRTEIRIYDVPMKNLDEFKAFLKKYDEKSGLPLGEQRFLEPDVYASGKINLRSCSEKDLAMYVLNYVSRSEKYETLGCNCQTFATDTFAFITGSRNAHVYSAIVKPVYKQKLLSFMYPSHGYSRPLGEI